MEAQTIWLAPRATAFTEICDECADEHVFGYGYLGATVRGSLRLEDASGWATCPRGHTVRILRMSARMPAGALH
jgi:hypothetical protein